MNEGWYAEGSMSYFKHEADAVKYCEELGYNSLDEAYEADEIYWTEWEEDHEYAVDEKGSVTEISDELRVWTYFNGTEKQVDEFVGEWEALLGKLVTADLTSNSAGEESWYCEAYVSQEQIDELNLNEDWFTIQ
jgi:hypothetical protein